MIPTKTLPLERGLNATLYVWYETSGYFTAYFFSDRVPLLADSEFLRPGTFYGPFYSHREAEAYGKLALNHLQVMMLENTATRAGSAA